MKKYLQNNSLIPLLLLLFFSVFYSIKIITLASGLVINHYPFITADGFDWITEGFWLKTQLAGIDISHVVLPIARPPLFVLITALDAFAGQTGVVISVVYGLVLFGTGYYVLKSIGKNINAVLSIIILVALLLTPVNFARKWILSDAICVFLSLIATYYLFENKDKLADWRRLIFIPILIAAAGLTQLYGLIAPAIGLGILLLFAVKDREYHTLEPLIIIGFLSIAFFALVSYTWYRFIPHLGTQTIFSLLKLSTGMFDFYKHTWGFYFLPFVPLLLLILLVDRNKLFNDPFLISLWLTVAVFMSLALTYQWKDARFTFIFWPFFIIAIFRTYYIVNERYRNAKMILLGLSAVLIIFQSLFIFPNNEWQPDFRQITINPQQTWYASLFLSRPLDDRFQLAEMCHESDRFCADLIVNDDQYVKSVITSYLNIDAATRH